MKPRRLSFFGFTLNVAALAALLFLLLPLFIVVPCSLDGGSTMHFPPSQWSFAPFVRILTKPEWTGPLLKSTLIAAITSLVSMSIGLIGAYGIRRLSLGWALAVFLLLLAPLIIPPVVIGSSLLLTFSSLRLVDTTLGIILGHVLLALPYAVLISSASMARADMRLEEIACLFGAARITAIVRVTLPQLRWGIATGLFVTFMASFDEPVITLFLGGANARTLPRKLFDSIRYDFDPSAAAIATLALLVLFTGASWSVLRHRTNEVIVSN